MFDFFLGKNNNKTTEVGETPDSVVPTDESARAPLRPTIALALGGGAARGFAHIGVIRTLMAKGFVPDVITGTSIGAVVGAMYAAGHLDAFEEWARGLTRRTVFGYLDFAFFSSGLLRGDRLAQRITTQIGDLASEDLPVRFAAIATEVGTGHEIWLTRGPLVDNLRASYALPGIFMPVLIGQRWLVDGALVNPVPVSAARALGARLVVAVNLNSDLFGRGTTISNFNPADTDEDWMVKLRSRHGVPRSPEDVAKRQAIGTAQRPGFSAVMLEAFNIMQDRITRARLAGDPPDVSINPRLANVGLLDFQSAAAAIDAGAEAAERALAPIEEALAALSS
ncbi:NTE family protein RssA [Variibacter gotjawalensis]|uniref:NTE family protein RssA n=1 Tax=Variibacter gotjawalensis TaxID=1333996 RepID=A0A0S3PW67_9BRAD|nr:patatin-like phospholipase family protein [Variibacter gotjawalensis]NIK45992.1 NTE family protein [Variibacter gotjawalensis]RZS47910.1 NTE family protein [Variibacter gotjawalensis]BAT60166.1 NTE family protein RssA [Variibacter gotjawalensis]